MTSGMVLGKFMPPHRGHMYLCDFARGWVDELTIVVGSLARAPIAGELRVAWMRELYPDCDVVHHTDENPQYPEEDPDFWDIWKASLERVLPAAPDVVFASEDYGRRLAAILGAEFAPCDRTTIPISGTEIRDDPMANWGYLPRCARPHFVRRVCVFGPESTGKTTLARALAERLGTAWAPEYARLLLESKGGAIAEDDIERIARGQIAAEEARARDADRVLICDTDVLSTSIWADVLYGACPAWIREQADARDYDLYLLCGIDVPYEDDRVRYLPEQRTAFYDRCKAELEARGRRYLELRGGPEERLEVAAAAVTELIQT